MKQKMIDKKKYSNCCANCLYGRMPKDKSAVLCERKGVVDPASSCRHYKYDPLKRVPQRVVLSTDYNEDDFKL